MKEFNSSQPFVKIDENDVLFITGSTGTIVLREDEYGARLVDGVWQISIEDEVFASKVAKLSEKRTICDYYEMSAYDRQQRERENLRNIIRSRSRR